MVLAANQGYIRNQIIESFLFENEMHMTRSPRVPSKLLQHHANWSIIRNAIGHRHDGLEPENTFLIAVQYTSTVGTLCIVARILNVIHTLAVCLPDVNFHVRDRLAVRCFDSADAQ